MTAALTLLLLFVTLAILAVAARRPGWAAPLFAFVLFIRLSDALRSEFGTPSIFQILAPGLVAILLARWIFWGDRPGSGARIALWTLVAYGAVCLASLLYAREVDRTGDDLMNQLDGALIVIAVSAFLRTATDFRRVVWALLAAGIFLSALTVIQQVTGEVDSNFAGFSRVESRNLYEDKAGGRAEGPVSANYYAILLVLLVPMALERMAHERTRALRWLAGTGLGLILCGIVLTYSRGGLVALAIVLLLLGLWLNPRRLLVGGVLAMLVLPFALPREYVERAATFLQVLQIFEGELPQDNAMRGRLSEVTSAAMMFRDSPLIGVGYGNFEVHYPRYARQLGLDGRNTDRAAHNLYLEIAAETGVVGLSVFLGMLGAALWSVWRARARADLLGDRDLASCVTGFGIGLMGYLAGSLFLHLSYPRYFWLVLGIAFGLDAVARRRLPGLVPSPATPSNDLLPITGRITA